MKACRLAQTRNADREYRLPFHITREHGVLAEALDFRDECDCIHDLVRDLGEDDFTRQTLFRDWDFRDVLAHLLVFDTAACLTVRDPPGFRTLLGEVLAVLSRRGSMRDHARGWIGDCTARELLGRWRESSLELADLYSGLDPARRVAWAGPDMSVRSCISARQMEAWAHSQALFDALGEERTESDRIRNIAVMGVNTFGWTFSNRKLPVPEAKPWVVLLAPGGSTWNWNDAGEGGLVQGSAVDFCRVVTQTRNLRDTSLEVSGAVALAWMEIAQCFAGAPVDPPAPGARRRSDPASIT